jgi:hypothetical protein
MALDLLGQIEDLLDTLEARLRELQSGRGRQHHILQLLPGAR